MKGAKENTGSSRYHQFHHAAEREAVNTNYALHLPVLDRLFGTQYFPDGRWPERLGVVGESIPDSWWGQMTYPFRRSRR